MKVLYLTNIPSLYRVSYFNELGKNGFVVRREKIEDLREKIEELMDSE